jgi:hypothetical protein
VIVADYIFTSGGEVPADGTPGYAVGCFFDSENEERPALYVNVGTNEECLFTELQPIDGVSFTIADTIDITDSISSRSYDIIHIGDDEFELEYKGPEPIADLFDDEGNALVDDAGEFLVEDMLTRYRIGRMVTFALWGREPNMTEMTTLFIDPVAMRHGNVH